MGKNYGYRKCENCAKYRSASCFKDDYRIGSCDDWELHNLDLQFPQANETIQRSLRYKIRLHRAYLGMDQQEYAELLGRSSGAISSWETGRTAPTEYILGMLEQAFKKYPNLFLPDDPIAVAKDSCIACKYLRWAKGDNGECSTLSRAFREPETTQIRDTRNFCCSFFRKK